MQSFLDLYHFTCKASDFSLSSSNVKAKKVDKHRFNTLVWRLYDAKCILIFRASSGEEKKKKKRDRKSTTKKPLSARVYRWWIKLKEKKEELAKWNIEVAWYFHVALKRRVLSPPLDSRVARVSCLVTRSSDNSAN